MSQSFREDFARISLCLLLLFAVSPCSNAHDSLYDYGAAQKVIDEWVCEKRLVNLEVVDSVMEPFLLLVAEAFTTKQFASYENAQEYMRNEVPKAEREMVAALVMPKVIACTLGSLGQNLSGKDIKPLD